MRKAKKVGWDRLKALMYLVIILLCLEYHESEVILRYCLYINIILLEIKQI